MNRNPLDHINIRTVVCTALAVLAMGSANAQNTGAPSYAGASLASTDYGTGLKVFLGGKITPIFGWEGQITSFGSEEYRPGYKHSATAIGASGTAPPIIPEWLACARVVTRRLKATAPRKAIVRAGVSRSQLPESATTMTSDLMRSR
jgi:hypothetical protein